MYNISELNIKLVKLSDKKVRLDYEANIICEEKVLDKVHLRVRYKIDNGVYKMLYPKPFFLNKLSNIFRVKKKFIHYGTIFSPSWTGTYQLGTNKEFEFEGKLFNNLIKDIYITDTNWYTEWNRDKQLNELLK